MTTYRKAYIRVAIVETTPGGMVRCLPVNAEHEAFDGAGFFPCHLVAHESAMVPAPIEREIEPVQLMYGGQAFNRIQPRGDRAK